MKIVIAQLKYRSKQEEFNFGLLSNHINKAIEGKANLIVFSSIVEKEFFSYQQADFLASMDIIRTLVETFVPLSEQIGILIPFLIKTNQRRRSLLFYIYKGKIEEKQFDYHYLYGENYHYEFCHQNKAIGVYFFEEIFTNNKGNFKGQIHKKDLSKKDYVILLQNAQFHFQSFAHRAKYVEEYVAKHPCNLLAINTCGEYDGEIFEGKSFIVNPKNDIIKILKPFEEDVYLYDSEYTNIIPIKIAPPKQFSDKEILHKLTEPQYIAEVYQSLITGIKDYFATAGFAKAVIGISGGIDSAIVACLGVAALGKQNVTAILLPSPFSTSHSVEDAVALAKNLGITYYKLPIENQFNAALATLQPIFKESTFDVTEENLQSRIRSILLMAIANKQKALLLNTSNKSELCAGYGTLYGDLCGAISVLGGVYKTQVYALATYINKSKEIIPEHIFKKAPSAELRHGQKDTDSLPEYDILDQILYLYFDEKLAIKTIIDEHGFSTETVNYILNLYKKNKYKGKQFCNILKV